MQKITISKGNIKTGLIPSVSLNKSTCRPDAPCFKECYMNKRLKMWKTVGKSYDKNTKILIKNPLGYAEYFNSIEDYLDKYNPNFFRYHVHGDIVDDAYLIFMKDIARKYKHIKFLAFTKKYELCLNHKRIPKNLSIIFSAWPGFPMPKQSRFPIAYMQDGTETRVENSLECPGNCESCGMCWNLKQLKKNVVFYKH